MVFFASGAIFSHYRGQLGGRSCYLLHFLLLLVIVEQILGAEIDEHLASAVVAGGETLDGRDVCRFGGVDKARVCVELSRSRYGDI